MFLDRLPRPLRLALYGVATLILLAMCLVPQQDLPSAQMGDKIEHTIGGVGLALGKRTAEELSVAREKLLALQIVEGGSKYLKNALVTDLAGIDTALAEFD